MLTPLVLAALAFASACGTEEEAQPPAQPPAAVSTPSTNVAPTPTVEGLPPAVMQTRDGILSAGDYEQLRPLLDRSVFLSDFGFGNDQPDPIKRWKAMGTRPLETMGALLRMPHAVKETNEGTLYEWPRFDPNSSADDISEPERDIFRTFMTEDELVTAFGPDYGYIGPRLGILADGVWWFFLSGGAP